MRRILQNILGGIILIPIFLLWACTLFMADLTITYKNRYGLDVKKKLCGWISLLKRKDK